VEPFILLILGSLLFGDEVGPRRIIASTIGFAGALLVIQPSIAAFGWVALYPLGTAFTFAGYMLITRAMSRGMHPVAMQLHTALVGSAICLPLMWAFDGSGITALDAVMPRGIEWLWLFGVGFWAACSHMCMTYALKFAPSATLAPLHYAELISAVVLGYLIFDDFPNPMTWAGIAIITGSGLYIIWREQISARARVTPPKPIPAIGHSSPVLRPDTGAKGNRLNRSPACIASSTTRGAAKITSSRPISTQRARRRRANTESAANS
jgi:drug/metabolite transporter (DMT)-like permease